MTPDDAIRLRQICLVTDRLRPMLDMLVEVFGWQVSHGKADLTAYGVPQRPVPEFQKKFFEGLGLESAILPVGDSFFELVAPVGEDNAAARFLKRRGQGGYMVITEVTDTSPFADRLDDLDLGLAGQVDYPTYHELQCDPRDLGGAILSFSQQREGRPFDGGWYPAGPDWQQRVTPGYGGIVAAEIRGGDADAAAERWAAAAGRPLEVLHDGGRRMPLLGSEVRFVEDEGKTRLAGIDIVAEDFDSVRNRAAAAGLAIMPEGGIDIGGLVLYGVTADERAS